MSVPSCTAKDLTPVNLHVFSNERPLPHRRSSFFQEPAHLPNDQRLVPQEHVVVRFLQLDDLRVLHACAKALTCLRLPLRHRPQVPVQHLLLGTVQVPVDRGTVFGCERSENAERRSLDTVVRSLL